MNRRPRSQGGSLVEILVAMAIAAFALLGLAAVQARSMSYLVDSENRRVATLLVAQMRERVSANQQGYGSALASPKAYAQSLAPTTTITVPPCAVATACDPVTEVPARLVAQWFREVRRQLPAAVATIAPEVAGTAQAMRVTVGWVEPNAEAAAPDGACRAIAAVARDARYRCVTQVLFPG